VFSFERSTSRFLRTFLREPRYTVLNRPALKVSPLSLSATDFRSQVTDEDSSAFRAGR